MPTLEPSHHSPESTTHWSCNNPKHKECCGCYPKTDCQHDTPPISPELPKDSKEEVKFWHKAIKIIKKGYNECTEYNDKCATCKAGDVVKWIERHIDLIESW